MEKKMLFVKIVNTFSGRAIRLRADEKKFKNSDDGWDWLSDYQRKRIENFFGKETAYYCRIFTPKDVEYDYYYC